MSKWHFLTITRKVRIGDWFFYFNFYAVDTAGLGGQDGY